MDFFEWMSLKCNKFFQFFYWIFLTKYFILSDFILNWILNWMIFWPDSTFAWIIKTYGTGLICNALLFLNLLIYWSRQVTSRRSQVGSSSANLVTLSPQETFIHSFICYLFWYLIIICFAACHRGKINFDKVAHNFLSEDCNHYNRFLCKCEQDRDMDRLPIWHSRLFCVILLLVFVQNILFTVFSDTFLQMWLQMQTCEIWSNHSEPASLYPEKVLPMHHIDQHCNQIYLFSLPEYQM